jgi:hypothetical protein
MSLSSTCLKNESLTRYSSKSAGMPLYAKMKSRPEMIEGPKLGRDFEQLFWLC